MLGFAALNLNSLAVMCFLMSFPCFFAREHNECICGRSKNEIEMNRVETGFKLCIFCRAVALLFEINIVPSYALFTDPARVNIYGCVGGQEERVMFLLHSVNASPPLCQSMAEHTVDP